MEGVALVFDPTARLVSGRYHQAGMPFTSLDKEGGWGDIAGIPTQEIFRR